MNAGYTWREVIAAAAPGERVVDRLAHRWRHGSPAEWSDRIRRGEVTLDGAAAVGSAPLRAGQTLAWARPPWEEPAVPLSFALLHRDDDLLAVAKPAGLPTMPSGGRFLEHSLLHRVRRRWPEAAPLHRLDRGTSGLVVFARSAQARRAGGEAWRSGAVRRRYLGLVEGHPRDDSFSIDVPIGERPHPEIGRVFAAAADGKSSRTQVVTRARRADGRALVEIEIASGRPHQIRIHLAYAGHPLAGEPFYGAGGAPRERDGAAGPGARPGDVGYALHAWRLDLAHPVTGAPLALECPPPPELRA
jgi:23S rRNA pseudouridine1911/1915/1917 synthase